MVKGDADVITAQTAESAETKDTVLVGDDTDLLLMLIHHVEMESYNVIFVSECKANSRKIEFWTSRKQILHWG